MNSTPHILPYGEVPFSKEVLLGKSPGGLPLIKMVYSVLKDNILGISSFGDN